MQKVKIFSKERVGKIMLYLTVDVLVLHLSLLVAMGLWYTGFIPGSQTTDIPQAAWVWFGSMGLAATVVGVTVYALFGMYNNLWKYASLDEMLKIFVATAIIFIVLYFYSAYAMEDGGLRRLLFVAWTFNTILFTLSRFGYRAARRVILFISYLLSSKARRKRVMVVGAGFAGYGVIRDIRGGKAHNKTVVIVVDDDPAKNNTLLMGVRVRSGIDDIPMLARKYHIEEIVIAMPSEERLVIKRVLDNCAKTGCSLKIIPPISDAVDGINSLRSVNISDLLYREEVTLDLEGISEYLRDRTVLVTGGGGSIGSELCRQIARFEPERLIIFDIYENNAFELAAELKALYGREFIIRIGSVQDARRVEDVFAEFSPEVVFHAAAHKHVPLMEDSPAEAVKNNIFGTRNVAEIANRRGVDRFVLLSTDKAVNPANVMGATKRITELLIQRMAADSDTKFMAVRFGNVLASSGSVIPIFQKQIAEGGPVTVTHPDVERFFMTIPEAAQLVLQAAATGENGRIFVLDMGSPVKIDDLARNLIKLSGFQPDKDIEIKYIGLRPGEKLYEELILGEEREDAREYRKKIFITKPVPMDYAVFGEQLDELRRLAFEEPDKVKEYLRVMLPNFI
ncbi:MAG: polysaccharide biosynthesis protein [Defluviitaleaceae bacterium]|nr:polysaccharide biosynthesis protein [Defluviitaleaceae bacterium]